MNNKKLLQAHVDGAILGQSATQMFTYEVFLWRVPIILTTNKWDLSGLTDAELDWVRSNCVAVHVDTLVYELSGAPRPHLQVQLQPQPRPQPGSPPQERQPQPLCLPQEVQRRELRAASSMRRRPAASTPSQPPACKRMAQG